MEHCVAGQGRNCFLRLLRASRLAGHSAATLVSTIEEARTNSQLCVTCNFQAQGLGSSDLPGTYGNVGRNNGCVRGEEIVTLGGSELAFRAEIFNLFNRTNFNTRRLQKAKQLWANLYLMDWNAGCSQEKKKLLSSGNCTESRLNSGINTKVPRRIQKSNPSSPGFVLVI
jgi:hypothetical protein